MDQCRIQYPPLARAYCSKGACDNDHRIHEYVSTLNLMHHAYNFLSTLNGVVQAFGSFYSVLDVYFHVPKNILLDIDHLLLGILENIETSIENICKNEKVQIIYAG